MPIPAFSFVPARSIDDVLARLDTIIADAMQAADRRGFFAVLYRTVTAAVKEGIAAGRFEDGPRMERLDVIFANRYLEAYGRHRAGERTSLSWEAAFAAASRRRVVIMQHLLLGMNAHINLDLGVAAAEVCPGELIHALEHDFNAINTVLASLETGVEAEVCSVSPWLDRLDHIDPRAGRVVSNFSIDKARAFSWQTALRLAGLDAAERANAIADIDADVALLARVVERPIGLLLNVNLLLVRLRETGDARRVMRVLSGSAFSSLPAAAPRAGAPTPRR